MQVIQQPQVVQSPSNNLCITESQESSLPSNHQPAETGETGLERRKSSAKVKRKYHSNYIKLGFFWTGDEEDPKPRCVLCYELLVNKAMTPDKLKQHFETNHRDYMGKPNGFFEGKRDEPKKHMMKAPSQFLHLGKM